MTRSVSFRKSKQPWLRARTIFNYSWQPAVDVALATARGAAMVEAMEADPAPEPVAVRPTPAVRAPDNPITPLPVVQTFRQFQQDVRQPGEDWEAYRRARAINGRAGVGEEATALLVETYQRFKR